MEIEEAIGPPPQPRETCPLCGEEFMGSDLRLVVEGQPDRHYVVCPRDMNWKPTTWDELLGTKV